jgi:hypothetical protein
MLRDHVFPKDILPRRAIIGSERDTQLRALTANPRGCPIGAQRLCLCDYRSVTNSMDDDAPEAEAQMRQVLGLSDQAKLPSADDSQRLARQAIRSQAAGRECAERQLVRAEQTIQDPPWCANRPEVVPLLPGIVVGEVGKADAAAVRSVGARRR